MTIMLHAGQIVLLLIIAFAQSANEIDRTKLEIVDTGVYIPYVMTEIQAGPVSGNMLNAHYFPGINFYNAGRYREAEDQFTYVIGRPQYLEQNARRGEFMSTACYLRAMIYLYHTKGVGRQVLAKADLEAALKWNPRNHMGFLELARLYAGLGFHEQAISILKRLLQLNPEEQIAQDARNELSKLNPSANAK